MKILEEEVKHCLEIFGAVRFPEEAPSSVKRGQKEVNYHMNTTWGPCELVSTHPLHSTGMCTSLFPFLPQLPVRPEMSSAASSQERTGWNYPPERNFRE